MQNLPWKLNTLEIEWSEKIIISSAPSIDISLRKLNMLASMHAHWEVE